MNELMTLFKKFNRKERFYLVGNALGNPEFNLSEDFINKIQKAFVDLNQPIPSNAFVAMDYHLDWIYTALFLSANENKNVYDLDSNLVTANQEDVDLLVAFPDQNDINKTHLILCECKAESSWTNKQISSKASRLKKIFGETENKYKDIIIHIFYSFHPINQES